MRDTDVGETDWTTQAGADGLRKGFLRRKALRQETRRNRCGGEFEQLGFGQHMARKARTMARKNRRYAADFYYVGTDA